MFATLYEQGEVVEIHPDGTYRLLARLPGRPDGRTGFAMGIGTDARGQLYVAFRERSTHDEAGPLSSADRSCRDATIKSTGLYRVDPDTGHTVALATRETGWTTCFPNGIAVTPDGQVYVSDFTYPAIWRWVPGQSPKLWSEHKLLQWAEPPWSHAPAGVNPIALSPDGRHLLAGTVGNPMILRFELAAESPEPEILQRDGGPSDGLAVDSDGTVYISEILRNEIWALRADGAERHLVANSRHVRLDGNAGLARFKARLCVANVGFPKTEQTSMARTVVCVEDFEPPWQR